jgi:SOS regulatory protein LexA
VAPQEQSREAFDWETSLRLARDALAGKSTNVASRLLLAITNAAQMAELCHDKLAMWGTKKLHEPTFKDWQKFLFMLYKDSWNSYPKYNEVRFDDLTSAAQAALFSLQEMQGDPSQRTAVAGNLIELVKQLKALQAQLAQQSAGRETREAPLGTELEEVAHVPLVGQVAAGRRILTDEDIEGIFPLPRQLVGKGTLFLLRVSGDSMLDAAIVDGDWIVVRQQPEAHDGEIVAAMIDGAVVVKTFKRRDNEVWLVSKNLDYPPIPARHAEIFGKVVAVLRRVPQKGR